MKTFYVPLTREVNADYHKTLTIRVPEDCQPDDIQKLDVMVLLDLSDHLEWEQGDSEGVPSDEKEITAAPADRDPDAVLKWGRNGLEVDD